MILKSERKKNMGNGNIFNLFDLGKETWELEEAHGKPLASTSASASKDNLDRT